MYEKNTVIINPTGLHARPASDFVKKASSYQSKITLTNAVTGRGANAKSIVLLLSLGLACGTPVKLAAEGEDEVVAVDALIELLDRGCGEAVG